MRSELNIEEIDNPKFNARIFLFVSWQCNKCTFLIVIYLVCSFYISKLCCVFPVLHVVPISPAPNIARSTSSASLPFVCRWGDAADANFSARFLRGFMGFSLQMRYYFFKNLPNLYINISKNRVIQLYSYRTYFIYLLLFLGVTLTPTCRVFIYIYIYVSLNLQLMGMTWEAPTFPHQPLQSLCEADVLNSGLVLVARTDAEAATMIDSNIDARCAKKCCQGLKQLMMKNACYLQMRWEKRGGQYAIYSTIYLYHFQRFFSRVCKDTQTKSVNTHNDMLFFG